MQLETHNIKGTPQEYETYSMPSKSNFDFWESVTNVVCPSCGQGMILWNESGYVPGYRTCDHCHNDFMAKGNAQNPKLVKIGKNVHWK